MRQKSFSASQMISLFSTLVLVSAVFAQPEHLDKLYLLQKAFEQKVELLGVGSRAPQQLCSERECAAFSSVAFTQVGTAGGFLPGFLE